MILANLLRKAEQKVEQTSQAVRDGIEYVRTKIS